ncbi:hypothetical protein JW933_09485 [candidate division FCPU426 bacterium]|nr:hypothetical protein [candidate division FCPU426 bacterium]
MGLEADAGLTWNVFTSVFAREIAGPLQSWLVQKRWFRSKNRRIRALEILDGEVQNSWILCWVKAKYDRETEIYFIPLKFTAADTCASVSGICKMHSQATSWILTDACQDQGFLSWFAARLLAGKTISLAAGELRFFPAPGSQAQVISLKSIRVPETEQSNTSYLVEQSRIVKIYRKYDETENPEIEMLQLLTCRGFAGVPQLQAHAHYHCPGLTGSLAVMQQYVPNAGDGWQYTLRELEHFMRDGERADSGRAWLQERAAENFTGLHRLGQLTGMMHHLLGLPAGQENMRPAACRQEDVEVMQRQFISLARTVREAQARKSKSFTDEGLKGNMEGLRQNWDAVSGKARVLEILASPACDLIRIHGDYHLGQTLCTETGWMIIDFEGEPLRPVQERKRKACPLKDVAGMLRSLNYAAEVAAMGKPAAQRALAADWEQLARQYFLEGYFSETLEKQAAFLPKPAEQVRALLDFFELEKALYELNYELNNRPEWIKVPLLGLMRLLAGQG